MAERELKQQKSKFGKVIDILLWVMIAVLLAAVLVRVFVFTQIRIDGVSMTSSYYEEEDSKGYDPNLTFHHNEVVNVSKLKKPSRGDVVIFYEKDGNNKFFDLFSSKTESNGNNKKLIKRVVALGGDKIWVEKVADTDNVYMVVVETAQGETLQENYYTRHGEALLEEAFFIDDDDVSGLGLLISHVGKDNALVIEENCFFAMGDNRGNSSDSRIFGAVPMARLYGVVTNA